MKYYYVYISFHNKRYCLTSQRRCVIIIWFE